MAHVTVTVLGAGDEARLEAFLAAHPDSSMFLRANLRAVGLVDRGEPLHGTYAAAVDGDRIIAVACHTWHGVVLLQAPVALDAVARLAVERSGRSVRGFIGPWAQVLAARDALRLGESSTRHVSREILYALPLAGLAVPESLRAGVVTCRRPSDAELTLIAKWRAAYNRETVASDDPLEARREVERLHAAGVDFVLVRDGAPVAYSTFNARLPEMVQVGGVFTPPVLRSRGYGRCVVAGSLLQARTDGAERAILFTAETNWPARHAYEALGFRAVGDYGLMFFTATR
jgi:GNAT superfamily N-acetyltransferase